MFGEGSIKLPIELGQVTLKANGSLIHKLEDNSLSLDVILQLNFFFNQKSLEAMASDLNSLIALDKVDLSRKIIKKTLYECIDPKDATTALSQIKLFGAPTQMPKGFESTITLADLKLKWNQKTRSFISNGKIGIGTVGNIQINKKVNGFIEITKRRSGDFMTLYINLGEDKYYVFTYTKGSMQVNSHNPEFINPISAQKSSERKVKVTLGKQKYYYLVGTSSELNKARIRYKQIIGGDESSVENKDEENKKEGKEEKEEKNN